MLIYFFVFILLALTAFMTGKYRSIALLGFFCFSVIYVFEAHVGSDYAAYMSYYESMNSIKDLSVGGFEIGYNFVALVFHKIGIPFQLYHICIFAVIDLFFFKAALKMNLELGIAALLALFFVFYPSLEAMRQELAVSMFFYSMTFIKGDGKTPDKIKYFIINAIGFFFHRTAILAFLFYFFRKSRLSKVVIGLVFVFFSIVQPYVLSFLSRFPLFYNRFYYYFWVRSASNVKVSLVSNKLLEYSLIFIILLFVILMNKANIRLSQGKIIVQRNQSAGLVEKAFANGGTETGLDSIENLSFNLVGLGLIIQLFISPIMSSTYRLVYYCDLGVLMFYTALHKRIKFCGLRLLYTIMLIAYVGIRLSRVFPFDDDRFVYHFMF